MRKNSLTRQVRRAYDQDELARICQLREDRFGRAFGMETVRVEPKWPPSYRSDQSELPEDYYHFRDNNSSVLAVAHLDTVVRQKGRTPHFRSTERGPLITSGALDDRLGAYVITKLLPKLGVTCDWLLTVGEESGASTAERFNPGGKKYDWVIEFDRGGTDVVMYQYEDRASERLVEAAGAEMGWGSFSDIAYLEHLGVKAFNWGVGYRGNYHSEAGYAYLNDTFSMVAQYLRFHEQNAGTRMPHDPDQFRSSRSYDKKIAGYYSQDNQDDYYDDCNSCGEKNVVDSVTWYCTFCGICADCGATDPDVAAEWNDPDVEVCQCYAPKQRGTGDSGDRDDWKSSGTTWTEYLAQRPGKDSADNDECGDCGKNQDACTCALDAADDEWEGEDAPPAAPRISAAPPWSEHRPDVSHGLGVPTDRNMLDKRPWNRETGPWAAADPPGDQAGDADRLRAERDQLTARFGEARRLAAEGDDTARGQWMSAVNPPAAFPDADQGWHAGTSKGADGLHVVAHTPGQGWAQICLRCAARWPHPIANRDIHPESGCPGCDRCTTANGGPVTGLLHFIPAHLAGDSDACARCAAEVHQAKATISRLDR